MSRSCHSSSCPTTRSLGSERPWREERPDELVGRFLAGKFRLAERIGRGAYGAVYRAEQVALHRDVAVKVLDAEAAMEPDLVERFTREACAVSRVRHPNTVAIFDFGRTNDGLLYLVMEYIQGITLTELVERQGPLALPRIIDLIAQVAMALEAIHVVGLAHADLKSDNLVVEPLPSGELVKVVDFGIARRLESGRGPGAGDHEDPAPGSGARERDEPLIAPHVRGTPGYVAPEVIRGAAPERAADIYAAGVVLYWLITGALPFTGRHPREILRRQVLGPVLPPSIARPDVPAVLDELVLRAMAREPAERYADAGELRCAIESAAMALAPGALPYAVCPRTSCDDCAYAEPALGPCAGARDRGRDRDRAAERPSPAVS